MIVTSDGALPDAAAMGDRYGTKVPVLVRRNRLSCSSCDGREFDMMLTG